MSKYTLGVAFWHPELIAIGDEFERRISALEPRMHTMPQPRCTGTYGCDCRKCQNCESAFEGDPNDAAYRPPEPPEFDAQHSCTHGTIRVQPPTVAALVTLSCLGLFGVLFIWRVMR